MTWANEYVGLPFKLNGQSRSGIDCYGLVRVVYAHRLGLVLPEANYHRAEDMRDLFRSAMNSGRWRKVEVPAAAYDVLVFRIGDWPVHCAVALDGKLMLHAMHGSDSVIERYDALRWQRRLVGAYRLGEAAQ